MSEKAKKQGKIGGAWKGFKSEWKKIVWPTWKQVLKNTGIVVAIVAICTVAVGLFDTAFNALFRFIMQF